MNQKQAINVLEKSIETGRILKGIVKGRELVNDEVYAYVVYNKEKVLIKNKDLSNHDVRDKAGVLMGAEINFVVLEYNEELKTFLGSRLLAMELIKERTKDKIPVGSEAYAKVIISAKNDIVVDLFGNEIRIKSKELKIGWVEDARDLIKVGEELRVKITSIDPLEVEILKNKIKFDPEKYKVGNEYLAKIIGTPDFGIIVEIDEDRQVLCFKPEWRENVQIGQLVVIQINDIKPEEERTYGYIKKVIRR